MAIAISGVAGFIASHLAEKLISEGETVYGIDNLTSGSLSNIESIKDEKRFHLNICDLSEGLESLKGKHINTVYHLACCKKLISDVNPCECVNTNIRQTLDLMIWAENNGVKRFVHSSTGSIYGPAKVTEIDTPKNPTSFYGINKYTAESYLKFFSFRSFILRYFHIYGHRNRMGVIGKFITALKNDEPLIVFGDGTQQRTFTHVNDVVKANLYLTKPGIYNVSAGVSYSLLQVIQMLEKISGKRAVIDFREWMPGEVKRFNVIENTGMKYLDFKTELTKLWETW